MLNIIVFGLGAIGSNIALQLGKQYKDIHIIGVDFDRVEERNVRTQAYFVQHIGYRKSDCMGPILISKKSNASYLSINKKIETIDDIYEIKNKIKEGDYLILDCFDNVKSRMIFNGLGKDEKCLHIGFSPTFTAEIIWHKDYSVPGDIQENLPDICTLDEAVAFIAFVTSFASIVIGDFIQNKTTDSFIIKNKYEIVKL
jgi:hypothetical protein